MDEEQYAENFNAAAESYYSAQDPRSQVEALESLVRLADSVQDVHGGYNARMEMIQCATFAGLKDKALVAFTWCLAQSDKSPDVFDAHTLLWKFKWVLENIPNFLQVPKKKIYELQDDMQQRLLAAGYNLRPVQFLRWTNAMRMGEFDRAAVYMEKWEQTSRDEMADCLACEQNKLSEYFGRIGKLKQSDEMAAKLLDGRMTCAEIPHLTYGHLVPTYLKLGRSDELKKKHRAWYKLIKDNEEFLAPVSHHLLLVGGAGKYPAAIAMFERHAPWAIKTVNDTHRFIFYNAAGLVFKHMAPSEPNIRMHVPSEFEFKRDDQSYDCAELSAWFLNEAKSLAARFDQRNENGYYSELMSDAEKLISLI